MTTISTASTTPFGFAGLAPASPQSARGESVIVEGPRTELVAASQANAPLYDQRAQLTDTKVAARTAAVELAARQGDMPRQPESNDRPAPPPPGHVPPHNAQLAPHQRVQASDQPAAEQSDEDQDRSRMQQRARMAYTSPAADSAQPGDYFSMAI